MLSAFIWVLACLTAINLALCLVIIMKMKKQEQFHTGEAHTHMELINKSLQRLSEITYKLEGIRLPPQKFQAESFEIESGGQGQGRNQPDISNKSAHRPTENRSKTG